MEITGNTITLDQGETRWYCTDVQHCQSYRREAERLAADSSQEITIYGTYPDRYDDICRDAPAPGTSYHTELLDTIYYGVE